MALTYPHPVPADVVGLPFETLGIIWRQANAFTENAKEQREEVPADVTALLTAVEAELFKVQTGWDEEVNLPTIARELGVTHQTAKSWRRDFIDLTAMAVGRERATLLTRADMENLAEQFKAVFGEQFALLANELPAPIRFQFGLPVYRLGDVMHWALQCERRRIDGVPQPGRSTGRPPDDGARRIPKPASVRRALRSRRHREAKESEQGAA